MSIEIAQQLAHLCREGKNFEAIEKLYSPDIVSIEASAMEGLPQEMKGIDAITGKNQWWFENHEVHGGEVAGPFPPRRPFHPAVQVRRDAQADRQAHDNGRSRAVHCKRRQDRQGRVFLRDGMMRVFMNTSALLSATTRSMASDFFCGC